MPELCSYTHRALSARTDAGTCYLRFSLSQRKSHILSRTDGTQKHFVLMLCTTLAVAGRILKNYYSVIIVLTVLSYRYYAQTSIIHFNV